MSERTNKHSSHYTREHRTELLAVAAPDALTDLADRCLSDGATPTVLAGPEVGMVMLSVREPVARERFYLGEVLVTRAEVELADARGWAMVMGRDRLGALAAAICDAEVEAGRPRAGEVVELCAATEADRARADATEQAELAPTEVRFEELT
ncbi:hypothetical protein BH24ACT3_BH24ACT3_08350 [soil metagenome]